MPPVNTPYLHYIPVLKVNLIIYVLYIFYFAAT